MTSFNNLGGESFLFQHIGPTVKETLEKQNLDKSDKAT
jgi:hypothetical protein